MVERIRACRLCRDTPNVGLPSGRTIAPLPHEPRPVLQFSARARLCLCGQAPGTRVHASGRPFTDPSGDRLRAWLGIDADTFYDADQVGIVPMGFCFPGLDAKGGDRPPRPACARTWHADLFASRAPFELLLPIGFHAMRWHLGKRAEATLTQTVAQSLDIARETAAQGTMMIPLPHPSWRNNAWLKRHAWFERDVLPFLRTQVARVLAGKG
ncbi:MAG: uracil-DNA glycosylase family protein [Pseudomonadota bacterium]